MLLNSRFKIYRYNLSLFWGIWNYASGELIDTVWKNTQLATQIRGIRRILNWLFCRFSTTQKKLTSHHVDSNPLLVCKKQFSLPTASHISKHHCSSANSKCDTCDNVALNTTKGMLFRRINPWKMSLWSFTTKFLEDILMEFWVAASLEMIFGSFSPKSRI